MAHDCRGGRRGGEGGNGRLKGDTEGVANPPWGCDVDGEGEGAAADALGDGRGGGDEFGEGGWDAKAKTAPDGRGGEGGVDVRGGGLGGGGGETNAVRPAELRRDGREAKGALDDNGEALR